MRIHYRAPMKRPIQSIIVIGLWNTATIPKNKNCRVTYLLPDKVVRYNRENDLSAD